MELKKIYEAIETIGQAEWTNRLIEGDENFENPEWVESGMLDGVPVKIYYRTTAEDQEMISETGSDWGAVDFSERIDRIVISSCNCDRNEISDNDIVAVSAKYGIKVD